VEDAAMMTQSLSMAHFYEAVRDGSGQAKLAANWLMGEVSRRLNAQGIGIESAPVGPAVLARLIKRIAEGVVSNNGARQVFDLLWEAGRVSGGQLSTESLVDLAIGDPVVVDDAIERLGLKQMSDTGAIEAIIDQVLTANSKSVDEFRAGKDKAFNALVGQVMKASQGKANPGQVNDLLKKKLAR
jgi:aspartyl-tRNA(Asn)/glutamyl-tRNA(Gln) amidotransferase subunit B